MMLLDSFSSYLKFIIEVIISSINKATFRTLIEAFHDRMISTTNMLDRRVVMIISIFVHIVYENCDQILCYRCYVAYSMKMNSSISRALYKKWEIDHWCLLMTSRMINREKSLVQQSSQFDYLLSWNDLIFVKVAQERYVKRLPASSLPIGNLWFDKIVDWSLCDSGLSIRVVMRILMRSNSRFMSQVPSIDERAILNTSVYNLAARVSDDRPDRL